MTGIRVDLAEPPPRVARLRVDGRGYPVPWFVAWVDDDGNPVRPGEGTPDFRVIAPGRIDEAVRYGRCWICGERLGAYVAYVAGSMCAVNRINAEPPCHRDCALYASVACPFLTRPHMRRREGGLPDTARELPGTPIKRNPGVTVVWVTREKVREVPVGDGRLFRLGQPEVVYWVREGRNATVEEIDESIASGLPILREQAEAGGELAVEQLERQVSAVRALMPVAA